jgi:hypothetical protein
MVPLLSKRQEAISLSAPHGGPTETVNEENYYFYCFYNLFSFSKEGKNELSFILNELVILTIGNISSTNEWDAYCPWKDVHCVKKIS